LTAERKTLSYPHESDSFIQGSDRLAAEIRKQDRIEAGEEFDIERLARGEYLVKRRSVPPNDGLVDWLLSCPHKGFFVPVESESTDAL